MTREPLSGSETNEVLITNGENRARNTTTYTEQVETEPVIHQRSIGSVEGNVEVAEEIATTSVIQESQQETDILSEAKEIVEVETELASEAKKAERIHLKEEENMFWYGFGQGAVQFFGGMNQALSASFQSLFTDIWDSLTRTEEMVYVEMQIPVDERAALRSTGLMEAEINLLLGKADGEESAETPVELVEMNAGKVDVEAVNTRVTRSMVDEESTQELDPLRSEEVDRGRSSGNLTVRENVSQLNRVRVEAIASIGIYLTG